LLLVQAQMSVLVKHDQILDPIVQRISVDVMDVLCGKQFSPERLFHHPSMRANLLAAAPEQSCSRMGTEAHGSW